MGLLDRDYMRRRFFDEEHPWAEPTTSTLPPTPQATYAQPTSASQQGRFSLEVTAEEYERVYDMKPPNNAGLIRIEVSRAEYERIYRTNTALDPVRKHFGQQLQQRHRARRWLLAAWCCAIIILLVTVWLLAHSHGLM